MHSFKHYSYSWFLRLEYWDTVCGAILDNESETSAGTKSESC